MSEKTYLVSEKTYLVSEKTDRAWRPDQAWLWPPSPREGLPEGPLVDFWREAVRELDLGAITSYDEHELRGFPPGCLSQH